MSASLLRTRWAAIGAAAAVSLGAGGIGITQATTSSGEMPIYIPIEPCRLADTRPAPNTVGPRSTPIGATETYTLSGRGTVGDCTLPTGSTGLSLNVTAVGATLPTFLTLFPADSTLPIASHLNPQPGQPPTPNAVNVDLDTSGEFSIYNKQGTVNVIIDVVGYFDDHIHTGADIVDNSVSNVDTSNEPGVAFNFGKDQASATSTPMAMVSTSMRVPSDGYVVIEVTGNWLNVGAASNSAECQLQKGAASAVDFDEPWFYLSKDLILDGLDTLFSAHRVMPIAAADNPTRGTGQLLSLVCREIVGDVRFSDLHISATFYATAYGPAGN